MILKKLIADNYASYKHEVIDFESFGNGPYLLCGDNGSGKSTIIEMITTALFNRCRGIDQKGAGMDELIHSGEKSFKIELEFELNNIDYTIIREKTEKSQKLKLFIDGIDKTSKLTETQQMINNIIKLDYETFIDTIIIAQGQSASFMNKTPLDRKKALAQILNLNKFNILENYTKDLKKDIKSELLVQDNELNNLFNLIKDKDELKEELNNNKNVVESLTKKIELLEIDLENELAEKIKYNELKKQQDSLINKKNNIERNINTINLDIEKYNKLLLDIENKLLNKNDIDKKILELNNNSNILEEKLNLLNSDKVKIETENKILQNNINELKNKANKLKNYNESVCNFCGQIITSEHKNKHLKQMLNEAKGYKNSININDEKLKKINDDIINIKNELNKLKRELNNLNNEKINIAQYEVKFDNVRNKLNELNNLLIQKNEELKEFDNIDIVNLDNKYFRDIEIRNELNLNRLKYNNLTNRISVIENQLNKIEENEDKYKILKSKYNDNKKLMSNYDLLQKAWSKNGIQALIIDNVLPQIEDEINNYLKILSNGEIFINFETQKAAKNGNLNETLDIIVSDSNGSRPYERYSGGQRTRIDFAVHIGLAKFLTKRSGANIDFFVIDEGLGSLDSNGRDSVLDTLQTLTTMFKQIFVISHIEDVKEAFATKILVTNDKINGSKVKLIN